MGHPGVTAPVPVTLVVTCGAGLVAVRPDGYVGFRCRDTDMPQLRNWLAHAGAQ